MIGVGEAVPSAKVKHVTAEGAEDVDSARFLSEGTVILFTVPGAFTPTCHNYHLPGYVALAGKLHEQGVDRIVCATVNDHHVTRAWARDQNALGTIEFLADADAALAKAMGLDADMSAAGMGTRFVRAALIIENGTVRDLMVEEQRGAVTNSGAPAVLDALQNQPVRRIA